MNHQVSLESFNNEIEIRRCASCDAQMVLARTTPARLGFNSQSFECVQCGRLEKVVVAADAIQSNVLGWLLGESGTPS